MLEILTLKYLVYDMYKSNTRLKIKKGSNVISLKLKCKYLSIIVTINVYQIRL